MKIMSLLFFIASAIPYWTSGNWRYSEFKRAQLLRGAIWLMLVALYLK